MVATRVATVGPEIDAFRTQFEQISAQAGALAAPLSDKQFTWQPAPDVWSVSLCLDHLNVTARHYLPVMDDGIAEAVRRGWYGPGPYSYNWVGKMMVHFVQPTARPRTRAPMAYRPTPGRSRHDVMAAFRAYQVQYVDRLHQANGLDLARGSCHVAGDALGPDAARVQLRRNAGPRAPPPCTGGAGYVPRGISALTDIVKLNGGLTPSVQSPGNVIR